MERNHERPGDLTPVSEVEKSYIENHANPDNHHDYTINAKQGNSIVIE